MKLESTTARSALAYIDLVNFGFDKSIIEPLQTPKAQKGVRMKVKPVKEENLNMKTEGIEQKNTGDS